MNEMTTTLTIQEDPGPLVADASREVTVIATNAEQMQAAQQVMIARMDARLDAIVKEQTALAENLEVAKKHKLRQSGIASTISKLKRKGVFYEKVKAALLAGYTLIPDMPIDVFAVRTSRLRPVGKGHDIEPNVRENPWINDQESNHPPLGEGRYVSTRADQTSYEGVSKKNSEGKVLRVFESYATEFRDEIPFPFYLAKPQILDMAGRAMARKIFDNIGVLPRRRNADPMVVGQIEYKEGYGGKTFNFLICWFVDTSTL